MCNMTTEFVTKIETEHASFDIHKLEEDQITFTLHDPYVYGDNDMPKWFRRWRFQTIDEARLVTMAWVEFLGHQEGGKEVSEKEFRRALKVAMKALCPYSMYAI